MPPASQNRFLQLDALRFFFALVVVLFHTAGREIAPAHGGFAVDFFFILSGFVLSHALISRPVPPGVFAWARLARLYPLHLLTLAWLACLLGDALANPPRHYSLEALGLNLLLLQGAWPLGTYAWNFPSWSIGVEFLVNVVALYPIVRARSVGLAILAAVVSWAATLVVWGPVFDEFTIQPIGSVFVAGGLLRGTGGILLGYLVYEIHLRLRSRVASALTVPLATVFELGVLGLLAGCLWADGKIWALLSVPLSALLVLQMATVPGQVGRLLQTGPFGLLGNISYSIYLIHIPLFVTFLRADLLSLPDSAFLPIWFVYFALLLLLSTLSFRYVERPAQRGLMRLFKGWRTTPSHETPAGSSHSRVPS